MSIKVFLDMDGVIADFVGGLHRALGIDYDKSRYPYPVTKYDIFEDVCARSNGRVSMDNLYSSCDSAEFWAELEWDPMGKEIAKVINEVFPHDYDERICICTSPMANPDAWKGKIVWLNKNLPRIKHIAIMTAPKCLLAKPGHVLIDDKDSNIEQFRKHGGAGFLVPQPWNSAREEYGTNYLPKLKEFLENQVRRQRIATDPCKYILESLGL